MLTYITSECMGLDKMVARVRKQNPGDDSYLLVKKAYEFAQKAHCDQMRKSGEPYFIHPASVASILIDLMIDPPTIAAGASARYGGGLLGRGYRHHPQGVWRRGRLTGGRRNEAGQAGFLQPARSRRPNPYAR